MEALEALMEFQVKPEVDKDLVFDLEKCFENHDGVPPESIRTRAWKIIEQIEPQIPNDKGELSDEIHFLLRLIAWSSDKKFSSLAEPLLEKRER
jgi:hypothetical protein